MATSNTNSTSCESLIKELCRLEYGDKFSEDHLEYVLHNLSINFECSTQASNPDITIAKIKSDLSAHNETRKSRQISELYTKLMSKHKIKNINSVLHFLRQLSKYKASNDFSTSLSVGYRKPYVSTPIGGDSFNNSEQKRRTKNVPNSLPSRVGSLSTVNRSDQSNTLSLGSRLAWNLTKNTKTTDSNLHSSGETYNTWLGTNSTTLNTRETKEPEIDEKVVLHELLSVFQGVDSDHIKVTDKSSSKLIINDTLTNQPHIKSLVLKLGELGWLHNRVRRYIDKHSNDRAFGLVGQAFCAALQQELAEYYGLLSVLKSQVQMLDHGIENNTPFTLSKLVLWVSEPMNRLKWLVTMIDNCKEKKGGLLASIIHSFMQTGDRSMRVLTKRILTIVSQPIFHILNNWIYNGELQDVYDEFFVAMDPNVNIEKLWFDRYYLRQPDSMIPSFITKKLANKILLIGKSINFLRIVCHDTSPIPMKENENKLTNEKFVDNSLDFGRNLQDIVDEAYKSVCQYLLKIMNEKFKLLTHLQALRKFLLLGQGDFIRHLLDLVHDDLALPASQVYRHNLSGLVEEAVRATNAQFEDQDVLARLSLRILDNNRGETGWDVFTLDYFVDPPLSTIVTPDIMHMYLRIFNFFWRAKRMEHNLATMWTKTMETSRNLYADVSEMRGILHTCNILSSEMVHFVHQMQYYIAFEVLECSWADLIKKVETSQDLDEVILAHKTFLITVKKRCLLDEYDEQSRSLFGQLRSIYDTIVTFDNMTESIFEKGTSELESRKRFDKYVADQEAKGVWGVNDEKLAEEKSRRKVFRKEDLPKIENKLIVCKQAFQDLVVKFLTDLTASDDSNLRHLSWRLNFNNNYKL